MDVVELRQYRLRSGRRDTLIELFDRELAEPQERAGASIIGQFRDLDRPDRFVWLRGFTDMEARRAALTAFYGGPVWAEHSAVANATMVAFDDVLLLEPLVAGPGFTPDPAGRAPVGGDAPPSALIVAEVYRLSDIGFLDLFAHRAETMLSRAGGERLALLRTKRAVNTYPALPVHEDRSVVVRVSRHDDADAYAVHRARLEADQEWRSLKGDLDRRLAAPSQHLRLQPTARSLLR